MRNAAIGLLAGVMLMAVLALSLYPREAAYGQLPPRTGRPNDGVQPQAAPRVDAQNAEAGEFVSLAWSAGDTQHVAVVDAKRKVMGIYDVNHATGAITLKSVRNIAYDLQMEEFNSTSPSPREIRALLDRH